MMQKAHALTRGIFCSMISQITALVTLVVFVCVLSMSIFYVKDLSAISKEIQMQELQAQANGFIPPLRYLFSDLEKDVKFLAKTPPIQGIIRASKNKGIDPLDGSTLEQWKKRLQAIFRSVEEGKSSYVQVRYVGIANNGKELVRINNYGSYIETVPEDKLQEKAGEPYFQEALSLAKGEVFFSPINLNRENGKVQKPYLPVIRSIIPVYDGEEIFGFIIINASYASILKEIIEMQDLSGNVFIINDGGDYIYYDPSIEKIAFEYRTHIERTPYFNMVQSLIEAHDHNEQELKKIVGGKEYFSQHVHFNYDDAHPQRFLIIALLRSLDTLNEHVKETQHKANWLIISLLSAAIALSLFCSRFLLKPLIEFIAAIKASKGGEIQNLPTRIKNEIGELAEAYSSMMQRLNEARQAEDEAHSKLQAIVDNTVDGMITIDENGMVQSYNKACEVIFGYSAKEVIGKNIKLLMPMPYQAEHDGYLNNYKNTGKRKIIGIGREVQGLRKGGEIFPLDLSVSEIEMEGRRFFSGIVRDITQRQLTQNELMRSNEELERFAYIASHDLQEPLRMVSSFTKLLDEEYEASLDDTAKEYMRFIMDASARMQMMVADLLSYSRIGYEGPAAERIESKKYIELALENLQEVIKSSKAQITLPEEMPEIHVSPMRFSRLMQNLIGNGIKYQRLEAEPEITIEVLERENEWVFSVADNGIGMKNEYLDQIFIIFKRLNAASEYQGTGIGLTICKRIVESFGGKIWAESIYGHGTTFYFTVPKHELSERLEEKNG